MRNQNIENSDWILQTFYCTVLNSNKRPALIKFFTPQMRGLLEGSDNLKVRRGNVFTRILCLVKLFEFVFFNDAIIIYSECHSPRLFASLRSVKARTVFSRISAWALTLRAEALRSSDLSRKIEKPLLAGYRALMSNFSWKWWVLIRRRVANWGDGYFAFLFNFFKEKRHKRPAYWFLPTSNENHYDYLKWANSIFLF